MPNIIKQEVNDFHVYLKMSDGQEFKLLQSDIKANYATQTGTQAQRESATIAWVADKFIAQAGDAQVSTTKVTIELDNADGHVTTLGIAS